MSKYKIITLSGVTASGKTSIARELIAVPEFKMLVSYTTRKPRDSDLPGEYNYVTDDEFVRQEDSFLWTNEYGGTRYATKKQDLEDALQADYTSVMILVPSKVEELLKYVPKDSVISVFVETPSHGELFRRLKGRGGLSEEQINLRMKQSKSWELQARKSTIPYRFVRNPRDVLDLAVEKVRGYFN